MTTKHGFVPKHQARDLTIQAFNCIWDSWGGHLHFIPNGVQKHIRCNLLDLKKNNYVNVNKVLIIHYKNIFTMYSKYVIIS
jgi:hypothetical protein